MLLRTTKVYPRVLDEGIIFEVCHDMRKLVSIKFVVFTSGNHDLGFTNSLLMAESGVNGTLSPLKARDWFSCLNPMGP